MIKPCFLKLNLLTTPFGVSKKEMSLSFALSGGQEEPLQSMRVAVACSLDAFHKAEYAADTGWFDATCSNGIDLSHRFASLEEGQLYYLGVQCKVGDTLSQWSNPLAFSLADGWDPTSVWCDSDSDFCLLRRKFTLREKPAKALLYVTALSPEPSRQFVYHAYCNGEHVCLGPARCGKENDRTVLYYEVAEVTDCLKAGQNCFGASCYTRESHQFAARLVVFDAVGTKTTVWETDSEFEAMDATAVYRPDGSIGTNYFTAHGQNLNGEAYPFGWDTGADCHSFSAATEKEKLGQTMLLQTYPAPPVKRFVQEATRYEWLEDGTLFVDLGQEIIGDLSIDASCDTAKDIVVRCGEELKEDGRLRYAMRTGNVYEEHWRFAAGEQQLTATGLKTFRYVEIEGLSEEDAPTVYGCAYRTDFDEKASYLSCSSELLNTIYDLCKYTIQATNQNLYVDSQSRERCAYEGDVLINMLTAAVVQDCDALSRFSVDYLLTHRTWPAEYVLFCILMARADYEYTGDMGLIQKRYDLLKNKLYLTHLDESVGLIRNITMAGNVMDAVLVDWPMTERDGYEYNKAIYNTVLNSVHYRALEDLAYLARIIGKEEDAAYYQQRADALKRAMIQKLYDAERGCFVDGLDTDGNPLTHAAQHATAFALYAGVYEDRAMQLAMADYLKEQGNIRMSVYGAHFLLEGLYQAGAGEYANSLLMSDDVSDGARTWAYMLDQSDATITTEAWNTANKPNMTWSHPWGSAAGAAIIRGLFGIRPVTPGFDRFAIRLQPGGLRYGALTTPTVKGPVTVFFDLTTPEQQATLSVQIPMLTTALISLPGREGGSVFSNGKPVAARYEDGCYHFEVQGGKHEFQLV
ncbi:MAG: family 78 glycoside hydrolase catalytic domain [Clostridia bacterium]|nr:family 78 glycoside hydrolase catalytic domain [Clostridia bacterium]